MRLKRRIKMEKTKEKRGFSYYGKKFIDRYLVKAMGGMAMGLFSTLIIGLIIKQIGLIFPDTAFCTLLTNVASVATLMTGTGIAIGTAHALGASKLVLFSAATVGLVSANATAFLSGELFSIAGKVFSPGDPLSAFIAAVFAVEIGMLISGKTKLDILLTPLVTIAVGCTVGLLIGPYLSMGMAALGSFINYATTLQPFLMGVIISVIVGIVLTLPISSAALCIMLGISGIAAGAATVGCCVQMVGFAVMSYRENKVQGLLAQGLGTSMLQMPNIVKKPVIWIPTIAASAVLGPVSTLLFKMENVAAGAGMGTSGLVGPIMTFTTMTANGEAPWLVLVKILALYVILPAALVLLFTWIMYKLGWIKYGDTKLEL